MTIAVKILLGAVLLVSSGAAFAADEFGQRFSDQAPAALGTTTGDKIAATAQELQTIVPAAGAEAEIAADITPEELQAIEPSEGKNSPATPAPQTP